jgi:hypothetical protein
MAREGISAIMMRRKALATAASMPMSEKEDSRGLLWWISILKEERNEGRDQELSSPGQWPGKSVEVTFVTVSALRPTIFIFISLMFQNFWIFYVPFDGRAPLWRVVWAPWLLE